MTRNAILCAALFAACGGGPKPMVHETELGTSHVTAGLKPISQPAVATDPAFGFRSTYMSPGGMWMPFQMTLPQHLETFKKMGVSLPAERLADPLSDPLAAVISLGGCTASFVSPDGLIVTNHHCVQGALEQNSTKDENLVENGFLAKTRADEKTAGPAQRVMVVQAYKDITSEMRDGLDKIADPIARKEESEKRLKQQIAACEKDRPWMRCQVSSFFGTGMYQLIEMLEIKDVRLVYAPARSVGDYGGEIDNWGWPRHTGDFSFFRAYVGKDGKPAEFSPDNVPYKPAHYLKVSTAGLKDGDFVMVAGFPASTTRTVTAAEVHHDVEWYYPYYIEYAKERYKIAESHIKDGGEIAIHATPMKQFIQNSLENRVGVLKGMTSGDLLARKDDLDRKIKEWAAQPGNEAHRAAIEKLGKIEEEQFRTARVDFDRGAAFGGSKLLAAAVGFTRWADERVKPDAERKPGFQDRDIPRAKSGQKSLEKSFDETLDRESFRLTLVRALQIPEVDRPWLASLLGTKKGQKIDEAFIDKTLAAWYKATKLEDTKIRLDLLEKGTAKQLKASKDPFVLAAQRIWPLVKEQEKKDDARTGELLLVKPSYVAGMRAVLGGALAPDANGTLRVNYGTIKPLKVATKEPSTWSFTVATQILAKDTGQEPFNAPAKVLAAIKSKKYGPYADPALGGELPVDFLSDLDTTGGNSGSPVLNGKGELVGLLFDGTKDGLAADVVWDATTNRSIQLDIRYMLWMMDAVDGADHLLTEMGITPAL
jgi:hypothetical protein